jgi:mannose-6-phosphate isomerase
MAMPPLYPLRFQPLFRRYLWGGRRLETVLAKPIGEGSDYAESWEIVDHGADQSVVAGGPLAGTTLGELVRTRGAELFGRDMECHRGRSLQDRLQFPLLFKYLDCQRDLSVQVHPDDAVAARLNPPDLGKTEAWVILDAAPGARVYAGLRPGLNPTSLAREIAAGRTAECLLSFEARTGDCIFIPAGTVHALGAGLLVAEIQQASDTTYRLFDWNRVGPDDKPRQLHVEEALAVIDYAAGDVRPQQPQPTERPFVERLVTCDKFALDRWRFRGVERLGGDERFHIVSVLEGTLELSWEGEAPAEPGTNSREEAQQELRPPRGLNRGETVLLPASIGPVTVSAAPSCTLLDIYLPS